MCCTAVDSRSSCNAAGKPLFRETIGLSFLPHPAQARQSRVDFRVIGSTDSFQALILRL